MMTTTNSLKISMEQSEAINQRTDNTMSEMKGNKTNNGQQNTILKTKHSAT